MTRVAKRGTEDILAREEMNIVHGDERAEHIEKELERMTTIHSRKSSLDLFKTFCCYMLKLVCWIKIIFFLYYCHSSRQQIP